ncbi:hypothetical protein GGI00_001275, partial [Coemansia sp. RSA 2681]
RAAKLHHFLPRVGLGRQQAAQCCRMELPRRDEQRRLSRAATDHKLAKQPPV